jgi:hypothetical protein
MLFKIYFATPVISCSLHVMHVGTVPVVSQCKLCCRWKFTSVENVILLIEYLKSKLYYTNPLLRHILWFKLLSLQQEIINDDDFIMLLKVFSLSNKPGSFMPHCSSLRDDNKRKTESYLCFLQMIIQYPRKPLQEMDIVWISWFISIGLVNHKYYILKESWCRDAMKSASSLTLFSSWQQQTQYFFTK